MNPREQTGGQFYLIYCEQVELWVVCVSLLANV